VFTAYVRTKAGKITLCAMPRKWREVEETAAKMSKVPDVERVSVAAYGPDHRVVQGRRPD